MTSTLTPNKRHSKSESARRLVDRHVASRVSQKDAMLYSFSKQAKECSENFMGWADLATNPPYSIDEIQKFADEVVESGIETVVVVGQGGSTQAPMTISKYNKLNNRVNFFTLDSDSPVRVHELFARCDVATTLVIMSSKSGGTIEPRLMMSVVRVYFEKALGAEEAVKHFVAITDPGSDLERQATEEGWRAIFLGEPTVGGRFSALSVFGLVPAALAGVDVKEFVAHAAQAQMLCSEDSLENPAIELASFLYDNYENEGRDKFIYCAPKRARAFGLWIEQLVAESVGKDGKGILPSLGINVFELMEDEFDRTVIQYNTATFIPEELDSFQTAMKCVDENIPRLVYNMETVYDLAEHFIMWEYATAMCGYLMRVSPFDQPDVACAKAEVLKILRDGHREPDFVEMLTEDLSLAEAEVYVSPALKSLAGIDFDGIVDALSLFLMSIGENDYVSINAFMPFADESRKRALESLRHSIAAWSSVVTSLEIGPRYLHSIGQLHKGGPNTGVFLILSTDEPCDIELVDREATSLGALAKAQAAGEMAILSERGRRAVHVHLSSNAPIVLEMLSNIIARIMMLTDELSLIDFDDDEFDFEDFEDFEDEED